MSRAALRALSRKPPTYVEIASTFKALKGQRNDRAAAILASALVEDALKDAILARLSPLSNDDHTRLFEGEGPLSTFSAAIRVGFALSIFGVSTKADLNCMRDIRNAFAHAGISLKFTTREVTVACRTLQNKNSSKHFRKNASPRLRYLETAEQIALDLLGEALDPKRPGRPSLP
jgi:hypothetical protein